MIQRVITFTEYRFIPGPDGTDYLEGHQLSIDKVLGKGVVHFHNKKGGVLKLMFIGNLRTAEKAYVLLQVERECRLQFIGQQEVNYLAQYEQNLKSIYGEKLVIK